MKQKLFTIGYTGFNISDFIDALLDHNIECLIDIREIPLSRKKGFSKTALSNLLNDVGIEYQHYKSLGSPRSDRHELRETGNFTKFFSVMDGHLKTNNAILDLQSTISVARQQRSCLMCCCPQWQYCHRKSVVDAIQKQTSFFFEHIGQSAIQKVA